MDCDVSYSGDARILFTIQGITAEIRQISFRGLARVKLRPRLTCFPFVDVAEIYFLKKPALTYSLGGVAAAIGGDLPGIRTLVRHIVDCEIKSRFVWPNRFRLNLSPKPSTIPRCLSPVHHVCHRGIFRSVL